MTPPDATSLALTGIAFVSLFGLWKHAASLRRARHARATTA